jgi:DNA-nicking Smr family endonuclease
MTVEGDDRRKLGKEERSLWEEITRSVRPLKRRRPAAPAPASTQARSPGMAAPLRAPVQKGPPNRTHQMPEPLQRRDRQRLARGIETIDARLDLHGKTQAQAHAGLLRFLRRVQTEGARFVLVITGKGADENAVGRGVLRRQVPLWLKLPEFAVYVSAFEQAHVSHGGEGALYVRVRRPRKIANSE